MSSWIGLLVSYAFVFAFIGCATVAAKVFNPPRGLTRKLVHIGVAHWWLIALAFIPDPLPALLGPAAFIVLNALSIRFRLFPAMEAEPGSRNLGTVWFPLSLLILVALSYWGLISKLAAGIGVMAMGWGDGLAAVAGSRRGATGFSVFGSKKSLTGSATMFHATFIASALMMAAFGREAGLPLILARSLAVAAFACLVELMTPLGLDNLSVPIATALFFAFAARSPSLWLLGIGFGLNAIAAVWARARGSVTLEGALMGLAVGTGLWAFGGPSAWILLMAFFLSSTLVGSIGRKKRSEIDAGAVTVKGGQRDAVQALATCGAGLAAAICLAATGNPAWGLACAAAFASSTADTWAGELGVLAKNFPRHVLSGRTMRRGLSGGVTAQGFAASAAGAALIAIIYAIARIVSGERSAIAAEGAAIVAFAGFAGALIDSILGGTVQAAYHCSATGEETEKPMTGGSRNALIRGFAFMTNDAVNLASSLLAGVAAFLLGSFIY